MKNFLDRGYWKMKDGTKIKISKMTDDHLINTINFFDRRYSRLLQTIMNLDLDIEDLSVLLRQIAHFKDNNMKIWNRLHKELNKRKLVLEPDMTPIPIEILREKLNGTQPTNLSSDRRSNRRSNF
jgi:hypothetical protein